MSRNGFEALKIQTYVLKVHIHCFGCQKKVKKLLRQIEGVYSVDTDVENQAVIVTGKVDLSTLLRKLERSGKHAEVLYPNHQNLNQGRSGFITGDQSKINGLNAFKANQIFPNFIENNNIQDQWRLGNYLNQNIGIDYQNLMGATESENNSMMINNVDFQGNGLEIVGSGNSGYGGFNDFSSTRPSLDYEYPRSAVMNGMQHLYHYNHPPGDIVQNKSTVFFNQNYKHQPHMMDHQPHMMDHQPSSLVPPYRDFSVSSAPYPLY